MKFYLNQFEYRNLNTFKYGKRDQIENETTRTLRICLDPTAAMCTPAGLGPLENLKCNM